MIYIISTQGCAIAATLDEKQATFKIKQLIKEQPKLDHYYHEVPMLPASKLTQIPMVVSVAKFLRNFGGYYKN